MKTTANILLLILSAVNFSYGQSGNLSFRSELERKSFASLEPVRLLIAANSESTLAQYKDYEAELFDIIEKLQRKQKRLSHLRLLEKMFYYVHRKKLDWYENYVNFSELFESGKYDCVTGTALYALILERLGYDYTIYEFDYHVFLVTTNGTDSVLIEATDPLNGFVYDQEIIAQRIVSYGSGQGQSASVTPVGSISNKSSHHINNKISIIELTGLQYFNMSVMAFNEGKVPEAISLIEKAYFLYPSSRIKEIRKVFMNQQQAASRQLTIR